MNETIALSKCQRAYDWIKQSIVTRAVTPGYRLVLAALAAELEMSVVPVREAIRQLEAEGLVSYERNVGARVALVDVRQYRDSMQALGFMEAAATALSAPALTTGDLREAKALNTRMARQLERLDPHAFTELNEAFHGVLFRRCPNARLRELVEAEWLRLSGLRDSTFAFIPERARQSVHEHARIVSLIERAAPPGRIERASRSHRNATLRDFLRKEHAGDASTLAAF